MEGGAGCRRDLATDVLVDILLCLPPNARRRLRLVSRHWRDVIEARTATGLKSRAKTLVVTNYSAYILDDLPAGRCRNLSLWTNYACSYQSMRVVGTCNGLICLCDERKPGGALTFANPVTGENLAIPPLPARYANTDHKAYRFTYDQTTGRYRVVHIPRCLDRIAVFVLGEASWLDVAMPDNADLHAGIISVNGTMYWSVKGKEDAKVMSFDLETERLTPIKSLPSVLSRSRPGTWDLSEVHGRLGIAFTHVSAALDRTDVWVMEGTVGGQERWSQWYSVLVHLARGQPRYYNRQQLVLPHFVHNNDHVLTRDWSCTAGAYVLYGHKPSNDTRKARHGVVEISETKRGTPVADIKNPSSIFHVFAHVETMEALSVYECW